MWSWLICQLHLTRLIMIIIFTYLTKSEYWRNFITYVGVTFWHLQWSVLDPSLYCMYTKPVSDTISWSWISFCCWQGSVLGPILYCSYTNPVFMLIYNFKTWLQQCCFVRSVKQNFTDLTVYLRLYSSHDKGKCRCCIACMIYIGFQYSFVSISKFNFNKLLCMWYSICEPARLLVFSNQCMHVVPKSEQNGISYAAASWFEYFGMICTVLIWRCYRLWFQ